MVEGMNIIPVIGGMIEFLDLANWMNLSQLFDKQESSKSTVLTQLIFSMKVIVVPSNSILNDGELSLKLISATYLLPAKTHLATIKTSEKRNMLPLLIIFDVLNLTIPRPSKTLLLFLFFVKKPLWPRIFDTKLTLWVFRISYSLCFSISSMHGISSLKNTFGLFFA